MFRDNSGFSDILNFQNITKNEDSFFIFREFARAADRARCRRCGRIQTAGEAD
jgi:hypothetical protein